MQLSKRVWLVIGLVAVLLAAGAAATLSWLAASVPSAAVLRGQGQFVTVLDPSVPFQLEPPLPGWHHRKFWLTPPMQLSFATVDGVPALRCETNAGGSIYGRHTDIEPARFPVLVWRWRVETPVPTGHDERVRAGDDHPVRWFIEFRDSAAAAHRAEIIWSNGAFKRGEYKYIGNFPHYVADGGDENVGPWRDERADREQIYRDITKRTDAARLTYIGVFCDSDNTKTRTVAYTAASRLQPR